MYRNKTSGWCAISFNDSSLGLLEIGIEIPSSVLYLLLPLYPLYPIRTALVNQTMNDAMTQTQRTLRDIAYLCRLEVL